MSEDIFLIRHGETVWNRERRMQGRRDSPLTWRGIEQARANGLLLRSLIGEAQGFRLIASPLGRAWQTAVIVAEMIGRDPRTIDREDRLQEMTWGDWDGLTAEEIEARDPALWQSRINDRWTVPPPGGGETQQDIYDRARCWLTVARGMSLIAVAHGALGRAIRCAYAGEPAERMLELEEPHDGFFRLRNGQVEQVHPLQGA